MVPKSCKARQVLQLLGGFGKKKCASLLPLVAQGSKAGFVEDCGYTCALASCTLPLGTASVCCTRTWPVLRTQVASRVATRISLGRQCQKQERHTPAHLARERGERERRREREPHNIYIYMYIFFDFKTIKNLHLEKEAESESRETHSHCPATLASSVLQCWAESFF